MELGTKIKWCLFIFSILQCMCDGCEHVRNGCYVDVYCSDPSDGLEQFVYLNYNSDCYDKIDRINGNYYYPMRLKFESEFAVSSFFTNDYYKNNNNVRIFIVSLEITNIQLEIIPDIFEMGNLRTLNLSNNNLLVAKLFNQAELITLETIDLSHNNIRSIEVDHSQYTYKSVQKLNLSYNLLTNIPGGVFEPFKRLEYLDLSHNYIAGINVYTFEGSSNVKHLYLSYNNISEISVSLFRFNQLEELCLNNNNIENLSKQDFETLINLRILSLEFNKINSIQKDTFSNTEFLTVLKLHNNIIGNINKDAFISTNSLKTIDLSNNLIQNLPKDLFRNKNITSFSITGNNLEGAISKGIFEGLQLITELDISYQSVTAIEDFAFLGLDKLTTLLLNNNDIRTISQRSFNTLISLKQLDLSNNLLVSLEFNKHDLISLETFDLGNNFINKIVHDDLQGLNRLRILDVSNNNITQLGTNSFQTVETIESLELFNNPITGVLLSDSFIGLHLVPILDLSRTSITSIRNGSFSSMLQLQELNISRSSINKLEYGAFMNTGNIKSLDLSFNKLTEFYVNGNDLQNLTSLYLNNNAILQIAKIVFTPMTVLNKIILSYNIIQHIDDNFFASQVDLRYLDISFNTNLNFHTSVINNTRTLEKLLLSGIKNEVDFKYMASVPIRYLELSYLGIRNVSMLYLNSMRLLTFLGLSNNNLDTIEFSALKNMSALESLDLSFNNISYIQPGSFKDNIFINTLNLSHNSIVSLNYGIFRGLMGLNILDVSYNSIQDIGRERFYDTPNLKILIADHNRIADVSLDFFHGRVNLDLLSIGHNPLSCENVITLKRLGNFTVSAVNTDESNAYNVDGIVCNTNNHNEIPEQGRHINKFNTSMSERILVDIRDILLNSSENRGTKMIKDMSADLLKDSINKLYENVVNQTVKLDDIKTEVANDFNRSNSLLERILKVMLGFGTLQNRIIVDSNNKTSITDKIINGPNNTLTGNHSKLDQIVSDVNQVKQELLYMENVISEIDRKISLGRTLFTPSLLEKSNKSDHVDVADKNSEKSFVFIEVCVSLILLILISFLMYKFYDTKILKHSRSLSTRHITDAMENSNL